MIKLQNGFEIPQLGLGTYKNKDPKITKEVIKNALEVGYRHFDTAQMYENETYIGEALSESKLKRETFFITTKLMNHHPKEKTRALIMKSLNDLKVDYIDLLLIHWPNHDDSINVQTWEIFEEFYEKGLVKAIGVSNFSRYQLEQLMKNVKIKPMVNQVEFHPALSQVNLDKYLKEHQIQLMGYAPLMAGHQNDDYYRPTLEEVANKYQSSVSQILIAWGLSKGAIVIPKTVNKDRLIENFNAKKLNLDAEDIIKIDKLNNARRFFSDPANNTHGNYIE